MPYWVITGSAFRKNFFFSFQVFKIIRQVNELQSWKPTFRLGNYQTWKDEESKVESFIKPIYGETFFIKLVGHLTREFKYSKNDHLLQKWLRNNEKLQFQKIFDNVIEIECKKILKPLDNFYKDVNHKQTQVN